MMPVEGSAIPVAGVMCSQKPFYEPLAFALLEDIRAYFQEPEAEKEFRAWLEDPEKVRAKWRAQACA